MSFKDEKHKDVWLKTAVELIEQPLNFDCGQKLEDKSSNVVFALTDLLIGFAHQVHCNKHT